MVNRPHKSADGQYHIGKHHYKELFGSRHKVYNGTAYKTRGELTKDDLIMNKRGRIVSKKKYLTAKKENRLKKYGYFTKKGKFGYVRKTVKNRSK